MKSPTRFLADLPVDVSVETLQARNKQSDILNVLGRFGERTKHCQTRVLYPARLPSEVEK